MNKIITIYYRLKIFVLNFWWIIQKFCDVLIFQMENRYTHPLSPINIHVAFKIMHKANKFL